MAIKKVRIRSVKIELIGSEGVNDFIMTINPEQYAFLIEMRRISNESAKTKGHSAKLNFSVEHEMEVDVEQAFLPID